MCGVGTRANVDPALEADQRGDHGAVSAALILVLDLTTPGPTRPLVTAATQGGTWLQAAVREATQGRWGPEAAEAAWALLAELEG